MDKLSFNNYIARRWRIMNNGLSLSKDSLAILLICSNLALNSENDIKPFTTKQWNALADKLAKSSMGRPSAFFESDESIWADELGIKSDDIFRIKKLISRSGNLGFELENLNNLGIRITTRAEKTYPKRLKDILKKDCPPVIFYCGDISICENQGVSIVGSRNVDDEGLKFTKLIAEKCVHEGFNIVSGGAKGVDTAAQDSALLSGGNVISFIADGLIQKIKKKEVRENISRGKLLMMSAVNPKSGFKVYTAMERNKYIYALSNNVIVVSSDYNKGGTWTGAIENVNNKWVPMYVRHGDNVPNGNIELIKKGLKPLELAQINDSNISIREMFNSNNWLTMADNSIKQMNLEDLIRGEDESGSGLIAEKHSDIDLFTVVWSYIKNELLEPKTILELCKIFNINKSQMDTWLKRALYDGKVIKLLNPVRYIDKNSKQVK